MSVRPLIKIVRSIWKLCNRSWVNSASYPSTEERRGWFRHINAVERQQTADTRYSRIRLRARSSPCVCISARSNWTANDSICQTNEFVRCHSMPRRTARESSNWIWFNVARIAAHYTLEISQISLARHPITCSPNTMRKSRALLFAHACVRSRVAHVSGWACSKLQAPSEFGLHSAA